LRKILVIGSNSFSGSDFVDLLLDDPENHVVGCSRSPEKKRIFLVYKRRSSPNFDFFQVDLNKDLSELIDILDSFKPEYIINFAAQSEVHPSWENPGQWFQTNAVALSELANILKSRRYLKRYVHISTPEVYGSCKGMVTETAPLNPSTPYAASKAAGDLFLFTLVKNFDFPLILIRATNVYGAHQQLFKIIPRSVIYLKSGRTIQLHGGGAAIKSYIHIRDVSRGEMLAMLEGKPGEIYHLSPEKGDAVKDIVKRICELMDKDFAKSSTIAGERLGQDSAYVIDSTKAHKELGWSSEINLEDGLASTISWIETEWEQIQKEPLEYLHKA